MKRSPLILALVLLALPLITITYRILWLQYPLLPSSSVKSWQIYMVARIKPGQNGITIQVGLPSPSLQETVTEERIHSGDLLFNLLREGPDQVGLWSGTSSAEEEFVSYRATVLVNPTPSASEKLRDEPPFPEALPKEDRSLLRRLTERWVSQSPPDRFRSVARAMRGDWLPSSPDLQDLHKWSILEGTQGKERAAQALLQASGLPARIVSGVPLTEGIHHAPLTWVEAWTGKEWERLNPERGNIYPRSMRFVPLTTGGAPVVKAIEGEITEIRWSVSPQIISQWQRHFEWITKSNHFLDRWSLFHLPPEFQETFRILLLVPIGALMISVLRNFIGFPTFGIFMPVLMALAFRSTGLVYGIGIFVGVVLFGFLIRREIDKLRLLLVPRLSVILTLVIISFTALAILGGQLGLRQFMAVGLLPFVILTMTIERFFVLTEEAGGREALRTTAGSTAVAILTFLILHFEPLQLTFFLFPELLFSVTALQILIGRYTGYRLLEFFRFRKIRGSS